MKYLVIALLVAAAAWFFFFRGEGPTVEDAPQARTKSPEEQFQAALGGGTADARQLAALCSKYPDLAAQLLRGRQIRIAGTVEQLRTSGMDGRRADIVMAGDSPRKIVLVCDLDQYRGGGVGLNYIGRFEVVGTELLYLVKRSGNRLKKTVITQGAALTRPVTLAKMGASWAEFKIVDGPSWIGAQTK